MIFTLLMLYSRDCLLPTKEKKQNLKESTVKSLKNKKELKKLTKKKSLKPINEYSLRRLTLK